jgi:hypothetical protein
MRAQAREERCEARDDRLSRLQSLWTCRESGTVRNYRLPCPDGDRERKLPGIFPALASEDQRLDDVLAGCSTPSGKDADIRVAAARVPTGIFQLNSIRESSHSQEVSIHYRLTLVRDLILIGLPAALAVGTNPVSGRLWAHVRNSRPWSRRDRGSLLSGARPLITNPSLHPMRRDPDGTSSR